MLTGTRADERIQRVRASSAAERRSCGCSSRQYATNSRRPGEYVPSGRRGGWFFGMSWIALCWSRSASGGLPVTISYSVMPKLQMSAL